MSIVGEKTREAFCKIVSSIYNKLHLRYIVVNSEALKRKSVNQTLSLASNAATILTRVPSTTSDNIIPMKFLSSLALTRANIV